MQKFIFALGLMLLVLIFLPPCFATSKWDLWVAHLRQDALNQGIDAAHFDSVFADLQPRQEIQQLESKQPERYQSFLTYRDSRADWGRISLGRREYRRHQLLLEQIGRDYGVDPCILTALWGMETSYGQFLGKYDVITALASLAYQSERPAFFRKELLVALRILQEGHIQRSEFKGEWAGASGIPQFLPSSWYRFAVDYAGDGKKDIWTTLPDALASMANYLIKNGWHNHQPVAIAVTLPATYRDERQTLKAWINQGVISEVPIATTWLSLPARLQRMPGGPDYLVFSNFDILLAYNHSTYYAGTVSHLAEQICWNEVTSPEGDRLFEARTP